MILLPKDSWEIKQTANKGRGVFAKKDILPGTIIGDYLGVVLNPLTDDLKEKDEGLYLLYYHDKALVYPLDISSPGVHLINHSCMPNSWLYVYRGHTLFFTLRQIFVGEELTISYLLAPNTNCSPCTHQCLCGSLNCNGSMHLSEERFKEWDIFTSESSKKTKRAKINYGKQLPLLKDYPTSISDHPIYSLFGSPHQKPMSIASKIVPKVKQLRSFIRQSGRVVFLPHLQLQVLGIENGAVITQKG